LHASSRCLCALTLVCSPACAQPLRHRADVVRTAQIVPSAAARIAAPFGVITSTFRTVAHNRAVGGVADSYHLLGQAIDIVRRPGITHAQIAAALSAAGFRLIESLDEGDHSHFAFGPRAQQMLRPVAPPPPPPPSKPLLAADQHGTLQVDLKH
jgi:Peptidase M15